MVNHELGAITIFDNQNMNDDTIVDVSILTNNIQKIYRTTEDLADKFGLADYISLEEKYEKELGGIPSNTGKSEQSSTTSSKLDLSSDAEQNYSKAEQIPIEPGSYLYKLIIEGISNGEDITPSLEYNTELLNYVGVLEVDTAFVKSMVIIGAIVIAIITFVSIVMLYTAFKMTYSERLKEFGMLSSIGMNNKQKKTIIKKETMILGIIGIFIGILIGLAISKLLTSGINIVLKDYTYDTFGFGSSILFNKPIDNVNRLIVESLEFNMNVPIMILVFIVIMVYAVVAISSKLSLRKLSKLSPIDAIRGTYVIKSNKNPLKSSNIMQRLFGIEGVIASKNIKTDKSRYRTITISLTISIILFLTASGIASNIYKTDRYRHFLSSLKLDIFEDAYITAEESNANIDKVYKIAEHLEENELINGYCIYKVESASGGRIKLTTDKTSNTVKKVINDGIYSAGPEGEIYIPTYTICYYDEAYKAILEKVGISKLADDEIILMDTIKGNSKYGQEFRMTDYKVGDYYKCTIENKEKTLKIAGIIDNFSPYIVNNSGNRSIDYPVIIQMVNENHLKEYNQIYIALDTDKVYDISERMGEISNYAQQGLTISYNQIMGESAKAQKTITDVVINCFIGLLSLVSAVNIYNTISSSMLLRKKDFAVLKSMGMSEKQINKMMRLEGVLYGLDSIFYGVVISLAILFITYPKMGIDISRNPFEIPWFNIGICIIAVYATIFISMRSAKKKFANKNIIDEIREDNI